MVDDQDQYDESEEAIEAEAKGIPELVKKLFASGVSAAFLTEEIVRNQLKELKIPKDIIQTVINGANKSKEDLMEKVSKEVTDLITKIDVSKEIEKYLDNHEINITITTSPKGSSQKVEKKPSPLGKGLAEDS